MLFTLHSLQLKFRLCRAQGFEYLGEFSSAILRDLRRRLYGDCLRVFVFTRRPSSKRFSTRLQAQQREEITCSICTELVYIDMTQIHTNLCGIVWIFAAHGDFR